MLVESFAPSRIIFRRQRLSVVWHLITRMTEQYYHPQQLGCQFDSAMLAVQIISVVKSFQTSESPKVSLKVLIIKK